MKTFTASVACAAVAIMAIGCDAPTAPADPAGAFNKTGPSKANPGIPSTDLPERFDPAIELTSPKLTIYGNRFRSYRLVFTASARGSLESPAMVALKSLRNVTFRVYSAGGRLLNSTIAVDLPIVDMASPVATMDPAKVTASTVWTGSPGIGSYVVMSVHSTRGSYSKRQSLPADFGFGDRGSQYYGIDIKSIEMGTIKRIPYLRPDLFPDGRSDQAPDPRFGERVQK